MPAAGPDGRRRPPHAGTITAGRGRRTAQLSQIQARRWLTVASWPVCLTLKLLTFAGPPCGHTVAVTPLFWPSLEGHAAVVVWPGGGRCPRRGYPHLSAVVARFTCLAPGFIGPGAGEDWCWTQTAGCGMARPDLRAVGSSVEPGPDGSGDHLDQYTAGPASRSGDPGAGAAPWRDRAGPPRGPWPGSGRAGVRCEYDHQPDAPAATWVAPSAFVAARDITGRILLVRRCDTGDWELPGGHVDPGQSASDAAIRETAEESGSLSLLSPFRFNRRNSRSRGMHFYRVMELAAGHKPIRYADILTGRKPRGKTPATQGSGHPPSLNAQQRTGPSARPRCSSRFHSG